MTELQSQQSSELSTDLTVITAEINSYKRIAGEAIFEIGRRLKHVKEEKLAERHGGWTEWLRNIDMDRRRASEFIRVYDKLDEESVRTYGHFGLNALTILVSLPPEERDQHHETESGEWKTPEESTVKELRQLKADLREEKERREKTESDRDSEKQRANEAENDKAAAIRRLQETESSSARTVDPEKRRQFYRDFIEELTYIKSKYGGVVLEAKEFREVVENDSELGEKIDGFDDFWKEFAKALFKDQTIIEMEA